MSTIKSSAENLTLNADGANNDIKFQSNGSEVASIDQAGLLTATSFAGSGASLTGIASVPTGVIAMWSGAAGAIPSGWVICDGNNSTPNLTDKFIKSTGTAGGTGGSATTGATTLTIAQMPAHTHTRQPYAPGATAAYVATGYNSFFDANSGVTSSTGGGGSHTHPQSEPVYFALIFIMKT
jgi:hypothetical protein